MRPASAPAPEGIVVVLDAGHGTADSHSPLASLRPALETLLDVARGLASSAGGGRFCVVTRGACTPGDDAPVDPAAATAWGLGQTIAAELPAWGCRRIDLQSGSEAIPGDLADALLMDGAEDRLAARGGEWLAARLTRAADPDGAALGPRPEGDYALEIRERGQIDGLAWTTISPEPIADDHVRIRVQATGLNFRDVLNLLGTYAGEAGPLGSECAGTVEAVGDAVTGIEPGAAVMAVTPRGFCARVDTPAALVVRRPAGLSAASAATIPIAFLTADWALSELGELRAGERVLIHAAAGGVGMAAVQLALAAGAEVFATANGARKHALLRRLGVRHVYGSRTLDFRDEILRDTAGQGVDVVLNSLTDQFIPASMDVLREGGRFLEIGKAGVWDRERFIAARPDAQYHVIYLGDDIVRRPERVRDRFLALAERFAAGELRPLPAHRFLIDDAPRAFRFMAQARHTGKIVLCDAEADRDAQDADAVAWITGGLGGLGLAVARDLVRRGFTKIALSGRTPPDQEAEQELRALRATGADVRFVRCDVASREDVDRARAEIEAPDWRIRHVFHAAGVLDDAMLASQSWPHFERVLAPKAAGAWHLHQATLDLPLESFVLFSAGAALLGSPGQANYAAANAFLDGLAALRRAQGLPALSIAWGPWAGTGMAARTGRDWDRMGLGTIDAEAGTAALHRLLHREQPTAAVLPIDWHRFPARSADGTVLPFFSELADGQPANAGTSGDANRGQDWSTALAAARPHDRGQMIERLVATEIAHVLGMDPGRRPGRRAGLTDLGMDSLMAVELSNRLSRKAGTRLPSTFAFEHPTIEAIAAELLRVLAPANGAARYPEEAAGRPPAESNRNGGEIEALSEDETADALLQELAKIGY